MKGNFPTSTYNRKSGIVAKKTVRWIFIEIVQYLIQSGKKSTSTYNRNPRVLNSQYYWCRNFKKINMKRRFLTIPFSRNFDFSCQQI